MALFMTENGLTAFFSYIIGNMNQATTTPKFKVYDESFALVDSITSTSSSFTSSSSGVEYNPTINSIPLLFTIPPSTAYITELRLYSTTTSAQAHLLGETEFARWTFTAGTYPEFPDGGTLSFSQFLLDLGVE